jgi:hypothetical protein
MCYGVFWLSDGYLNPVRPLESRSGCLVESHPAQRLTVSLAALGLRFNRRGDEWLVGRNGAASPNDCVAEVAFSVGLLAEQLRVQ